MSEDAICKSCGKVVGTSYPPYNSVHACTPAPPASRSLEERMEAAAKNDTYSGVAADINDTFTLTETFAFQCAAFKRGALWGLKQGEEERARLQRACAERCEQQQKLADDVRKVARERDATQAKCEALEARIQELRAALELIAAPKRADGTYNRSREACAQLAREALAKDG